MPSLLSDPPRSERASELDQPTQPDLRTKRQSIIHTHTHNSILSINETNLFSLKNRDRRPESTTSAIVWLVDQSVSGYDRKKMYLNRCYPKSVAICMPQAT